MLGATADLASIRRIWECQACGHLVLTNALAGAAVQNAQRVSVCGACGSGPYVEVGMLMPLQKLRRVPGTDDTLDDGPDD